MHPHWLPFGSHSHTAFSPHTEVPSPFWQIFVQKVAVGSPRVAQMVASLLPKHCVMSVQYLPTPFEFPVSPGEPQFAAPSPPPSVAPLEPDDPLDPLDPDDPLDPLDPEEPLDPLEPLEPDDPLDPLDPPDEPAGVDELEPLQEATSGIQTRPAKKRTATQRMRRL